MKYKIETIKAFNKKRMKRQTMDYKIILHLKGDFKP